MVIGKGSPDLCPVVAVLDNMARRGNAVGPLFRFRDGRFLTRARFVAAVRSALVEAGLDARLYSGHSFRIGAATTAAVCGIQDSCIDKDAGPLAELSLHSVHVYVPLRTPPGCAARRGRTSLCLTEWVNRGVLFASVGHRFKLLMCRICGLWSKKGT